MSIFEQRAYIKSRTALNESAVAISFDLEQIHGNSALSYRKVIRWVNRFTAGIESLEDENRSGRPVTRTNLENIRRVEALIDENPSISYEDLKHMTSLSHGTLGRIVTVHLDLRKLRSRWVPHLLSDKNKSNRLTFARNMLAKLKSGEWRLDQIITGDECWIYHKKIHKRQESSTWKRRGEPPDAVVRRQQNDAKTMFCVFIRSTGLILIHPVNKGQTVDSNYYIQNCLSPAFDVVRKQRHKTGLHLMKLLQTPCIFGDD